MKDKDKFYCDYLFCPEREIKDNFVAVYNYNFDGETVFHSDCFEKFKIETGFQKSEIPFTQESLKC